MAKEDRDKRDPLTGEPGAHPVGTGIGAAGGAVAGVAAGAVGGPVGMAVGGVVGAIVGGLAGKAAAEAIDPAVEETHWRDNYQDEPYYQPGRSYDDYAPAYRHGLEGRMRHEGDWDSAEPRLSSEWETQRGTSPLDWDEARPATRAAWDRVDLLRGTFVEGTPSAATAAGAAGAAGAASAAEANYGSTMDMSRDMRSDDEIRRDDMRSDETRRADMERIDSIARRDTMMSGAGATGMGTTTTTGEHPGTMGSTGTSGTAARVGEMQTGRNDSGDRDDVIDVLQDLAECSLDGEYGFRECADHAKRDDLRSTFMRHADECRRSADELNEQIRMLGGKAEEHGSASGAMHRGWVAVRTALTTMDDKALLEEAERGEDNAVARYRKALKSTLPAGAKLIVERQMQGVQRNHDQIRMLRDQFRAAQR